MKKIVEKEENVRERNDDSGKEAVWHRKYHLLILSKIRSGVLSMLHLNMMVYLGQSGWLNPISIGLLIGAQIMTSGW